MIALGPVQLDALREVASVGCGHGLTALARLLGRRVDMDPPEAWAGRGPGAVADFLGALGQDLLAVAVRLDGVLAGHLVLALPEHDAERMASLLGYTVCGEEGWSPLAESALLESGNILGSAFVSAIARLVRQRLLLSVPSLARGGGRACLDRLVGREAGRAALATRFCVDGSGGLEGLVLFLPDLSRLPALLASLRRP